MNHFNNLLSIISLALCLSLKNIGAMEGRDNNLRFVEPTDFVDFFFKNRELSKANAIKALDTYKGRKDFWPNLSHQEQAKEVEAIFELFKLFSKIEKDLLKKEEIETLSTKVTHGLVKLHTKFAESPEANEIGNKKIRIYLDKACDDLRNIVIEPNMKQKKKNICCSIF